MAHRTTVIFWAQKSTRSQALPASGRQSPRPIISPKAPTASLEPLRDEDHPHPAYRVELPLHEGSYKWSGGKSVTVFDSTIVAVETDEGVTGYGEVCPLGPFYLPAYAAGRGAGIAELGPHLLGEDPRQLARLNRRMDAALQGHPYVKSAIDMACWDILGKATGQPVCVLLGGRYGDDFVLYRAISQESPEAMAQRVAGYRAQGYRRFQLKVGGDPLVDIDRIRAVAAELQAGRRLDRRRQHRLVDARRAAGRPRGARRRRLHRAALPHATTSA